MNDWIEAVKELVRYMICTMSVIEVVIDQDVTATAGDTKGRGLEYTVVITVNVKTKQNVC